MLKLQIKIFELVIQFSFVLMTSELCIILKDFLAIIYLSQKAQHNGNTLQKMMSDLEIAVKTERGHQKWEDMIKSINTVTMIKVSNNNAR